MCVCVCVCMYVYIYIYNSKCGCPCLSPPLFGIVNCWCVNFFASYTYTYYMYVYLYERRSVVHVARLGKVYGIMMPSSGCPHLPYIYYVYMYT